MEEPVKYSVGWKVSPTSDNFPKVSPIQGQFFTTEGLKEKASALVRETIQNSLDAKTENIRIGEEDDYPVQVRFFFSEVSPEKHRKYLKGILPHVLAEDNGLLREEIPDFDGPMPFIAIEDFNTTGLTGNFVINKDPKDGINKKHSFYWFWRNIGRSDKGEDERGRWGLGKTVFPYSSRISTYFGLTSREEDNEKLLMGQNILLLHYFDDDTEFNPYGYFGKFKITEPPSFFPLPITEEDKTEDRDIASIFEEDFKLERGNFAGFSVVIPFPREELTLMEVLKAAVLEYSYAIISGDLEITISDGINDIELNESDFKDTIEKLNFGAAEDKRINLLKLIEFTKWTLNTPEEDFIKLKVPDPAIKPAWKRELLLDESLEEILHNKQERYGQHERIAFRVPVKVEKTGKRPKTAWFSVFIEKDKDLSKPDGYFIRNGLVISDVKTPSLKNNVRFIVRIDDPVLSTMLGDAENPAHTEWQKSSMKFKGYYKHDANCLDFVKRAPLHLTEYLTKIPEGLDEDILKDIFSLDDEITEVEGDVPAPEGPEDDTPPPIVDVGPKKISKCSITKITGGAKISQNPRAEVPEFGYVMLAYDYPRGNSLRKYHPDDFDIAKPPISITQDGIEIRSCSGNLLKFRIKKPEYWIKLKGFDTERDLVVDAEGDDA